MVSAIAGFETELAVVARHSVDPTMDQVALQDGDRFEFALFSHGACIVDGFP